METYLPVINGHPGVCRRQQQEGRQTQQGELHLGPVEDHVGQVGGDEGVDAAGAAGQVDVRVGYGRGQRTGDHSTNVDLKNINTVVTTRRSKFSLLYFLPLNCFNCVVCFFHKCLYYGDIHFFSFLLC